MNKKNEKTTIIHIETRITNKTKNALRLAKAVPSSKAHRIENELNEESDRR